MKGKQMKRALCLLGVLCACFLTFCGCSSSQETPEETTLEQEIVEPIIPSEPEADEQTTAVEPEVTEQMMAAKPETAAETTTAKQETTVPEFKDEQEKKQALEALLGIGGQQQVRQIDGVEVVSGTVERVGNNSAYSPSPGSGYFTVNGIIEKNSEIMFTIGSVTLMRYKLVLDSVEERTVKAEIRVYKKGEMLLSCTQEQMQLKKGANNVDVCLDTGEDVACNGTYDLMFYLDGVLVNKYIYEA